MTSEIAQIATEINATAAQLERQSQRLLEIAENGSAGEGRPGYYSPVGLDRAQIWPEQWVDATGYDRYYAYGWHTGADLNLNDPKWDADRHRPVYSIAKGHVYAVRVGVSGWHTVVCVRHADCLSRYAHLENISVRQGERVAAGQYLGNIGNAGGRYPYHLHFDIARLEARMNDYPLDWPGQDRGRVQRDYLDPVKFLRGKNG